jgi:predicted phosphohydrolase
MISFDYISDLHIDYWDKKYWPEGGKGIRKDFPINWDRIIRGSDILVVAGDVSDNMQTSFEYLTSLRKYYPIILFVDGNHEHYSAYPKLIDNEQVQVPEGIHYLPQKDFLIGKSVFIGTCGWWDYGRSQNPERVEQAINEQKGYIKSLGKKKHSKLAQNIICQSRKDYQYLIDKLEKYSKIPEIEEVIIVTHTVPKKEFTRVPATDYNSYLDRIPDQKYKITRWIFGHNHQSFEFVDRKNIQYLSNPRGRPSDWDRKFYSIKTT